MADWVTISSLATAGGTLVLAVATFASVKSANRAARIAEQSFQIGLRPVLVPSRPQDPPEEIGFVDAVFSVEAGTTLVREKHGIYYLGIPLRNVGGGLAVLVGWHLWPGRQLAGTDHADPDDMRVTQRDLYVPAGDTGYWQGAIREPEDALRDVVREAMESHGPMTLEIMYSDHEGGQLTITRFGVMPQREDGWRAAVVRHWILDRE